jgi:hypothetical protein
MRPSRRVSALLTLALFVLGGNFCTFSIGPARAGMVRGRAVAPVHACCVERAKRAAHAADATRESTAPCCVTVAPVVAAHAVTIDATPAVTFAMAALLPASDDASPAAQALALRETARPPDRCSATPDAGRAPPRL